MQRLSNIKFDEVEGEDAGTRTFEIVVSTVEQEMKLQSFIDGIEKKSLREIEDFFGA